MKFLVFDVVFKLFLVGVSCQDLNQSVTQTLPPSAIGNSSIHSDSTETATNSKIFTRNVKHFVCPDNIQRIPFLSLPCEYDGECSIFGSQMVCCLKRCIRGVSPIKAEISPSTIDRSVDVTTKSTTTTTTPTTTTSTTTTTTTLKPTTQPTKSKESNELICPGNNVRIPFWSLQCETRSDCLIFGRKLVCCSGRCIDGVPSQKQEEIIFTPNEKLPTERINTMERSSDQPTKVDFQKTEKIPNVNQNVGLVCPEGVRIPFFALLCTNNADCLAVGNQMICCKNRCIEGVSSRKAEISENATKDKQPKTQNSIKTRASSIDPLAITNNDITDLKVTNSNFTPNQLVCPEGVRIPFFSRPCYNNGDCTSSGKEMVCCSDRCIKGVPPKKPEIMHSPSWFGLVDRNCPVDAIVEILQIKECETDEDCRPRICCPDKYHNNSNKSYCRTPQPSLDRFPLANRATEPLRVFASYIQCTPPPPPIFDLFPKTCNNALDCFPNLCCQEGDKKHCRPPKRSVLQLLAGVGQRFVPPDAAKRLIERLN